MLLTGSKKKKVGYYQSLKEYDIATTVYTEYISPHYCEQEFAIYDTRGVELRKEVQSEVKQEVMDTINKGIAAKDINSAIHCIWYCINTASNRIEPEEIEWLRELSMDNRITQVPIIVVLTQSFSKKKAQEMRQILLGIV